MKVIITGGTGLIGRELCRQLCADHEVVVLTRNPEKAEQILGGKVKAIHWDGKNVAGWKTQAEGALAIINLAGEKEIPPKLF